ncbi:MAG: MarR family transcriptional regulator [Halobacteriota archaeon]
MAPEPCLNDLPPSAKLVYTVLEYDAPLTQKALVTETNLSARTVRYALDRLDECNYITEDVYLRDARQSLYRLNTTAEEQTGESTPEPA